METQGQELANLARTLRPLGLWYGVISAIFGTVLWTFHEVTYHDWPQPLRCFAWTWLVFTTAAPFYLQVMGWIEARVSEKAKPPAVTDEGLALPVPAKLTE